jgi:hypothetical protein
VGKGALRAVPTGNPNPESRSGLVGSLSLSPPYEVCFVN